MTNGCKAVIFDVYNTLLHIRVDEQRLDTYKFLSNWLSYKGVTVRAVELLRLFEATTAEHIAGNPKPYPDVDIGDVFLDIVRKTGLAAPSIDDSFAKELSLLFRILTTDALELFPETLPTLRQLQPIARLAIVSNSQRLFTLPELRRFHLEEFFDDIVFSSDLGTSKPNVEIFDAALQRLGVAAANTVYVGDNLFDDIWGAQQVGIHTVWVNRDGHDTSPKGFPRPQPDREVLCRGDESIVHAVFSLIRTEIGA
jgi:putative hydrolase of the HAD superfamily